MQQVIHAPFGSRSASKCHCLGAVFTHTIPDPPPCMQSKLLNAPVACPLSGGCDTVLSSGYAELFGIPLSAFGALLPLHTSNQRVWAENGVLTIIILAEWACRTRRPAALSALAGFAAYGLAALISVLGLQGRLQSAPARVSLMATATVLASTSSYLLCAVSDTSFHPDV